MLGNARWRPGGLHLSLWICEEPAVWCLDPIDALTIRVHGEQPAIGRLHPVEAAMME